MTRCCSLLAFSVLALAPTILPGHMHPLSSPQDHSPKATPAPLGNESAEGSGNHSDVKQDPEIPPRPGGISGATDSELQVHIQKALRSEPTLSNDDLAVLVTSNTVELSGSVGSGRERLTATRIARSYAGSKWVVNHLQVRESKPAISK